VSGIITNYEPPGILGRAWERVFLRGPFRDDRQQIYRSWRALQVRDTVPVSKFGSGLMSFRADVIGSVRFDGNLRGLPRGEDVDFCIRLGRERRLVIAPRARTTHRNSLVGRASEHWIRAYVQGELYPYYHNWRPGLANGLCHAWFLSGCLLAAIVAGVRRRSTEPVRMLFAGVREAKELGQC
jgi:GT2 family glycosyltransferase